MKLEMFPIVERTVVARDAVLEAIARVEAGQVNVMIRGEYQDDAMVAVIKPVMLAELKGRLASLERDLAAYGVEVGKA